ncbi:MAG: hypothetical protein J6M12_09160 [Clostridia bacterium]|nr:hypothetical protein [Clostridia bacterium]
MNEQKRKGFSALDTLIVLTVVLLVLGMIGQGVAVHLLDRAQKAEEFEISFLVRSYSSVSSKELIDAQAVSGEGLACICGERELGKVKSLHKTVIPAEGESAEHPALCDLTGILLSYGRVEDDQNLLYGYGEISVGDILVVSVNGKALAMEITGVNVKKIEKST